MNTKQSQMADTDPFNLERFVEAQRGTFDRAIAELRSGQKRSHWMWFIFPQIEGLGHSPTARFYAIRNLEEASAYLQHPVLGPRLIRCVSILLELQGKSASEIFGYPDDLKLRSSMTLFSVVQGADPAFSNVLDRYFDGQSDQRTQELLRPTR